MPIRFIAFTFSSICAFTLLLTLSQSCGAGLPDAATLGATNITSSSVTVGGQVNPNSDPTTGYFELGTTTNYGTSTTTFNAGSGSGTVPAIANFGGLLPNMVYHYRIVAMNSFGTNFGLDATFTTLPGNQSPPAATTRGATNITISSAVISGEINPNGAATTAYFELGVTTNYGTSTGTLNAGSSTSPVTASGNFNGLSPGTLYHYRVVAWNSFGTNFGLDATFTTLSGLPISPTAVDTNGLAPGHFVLLRQAAPAFGDITNITAAEALLNLASTNSAVAFDAYDVGIAAVNYADLVTSPSPQGRFGFDRNVHLIPGNSAPATDQNNYAIQVSGYLYIPQAGSWTFYVHSDEGFRLRMGDTNGVIMEFPGTRTPAESSGVISVSSAGYYRYQLTYFEMNGGSEVEFYAGAPGEQLLRLVGDFLSPVLAYHEIEAPRLNIASQSGQVVVSWPIRSGGGSLESNTNLASSVSWEPVNAPAVITGGQYVVTNAANLPAQFYRLKLP